ncbi:hypothetical protein FIBSPDRAFT_866472 [Athelia psychrophila]|uniref:Uncharacterized protein n=1 Tax=Athelia psychrophila TaxID=1759441 RepID=A0A166EQ86_9AGAM|nr:hypothetical protein FIBSPDRAFT_866472 [Fibularhizoctonia sp. CBS 109695]
MPVQGGIDPPSLLVVAISVPPQPARTHHAPVNAIGVSSSHGNARPTAPPTAPSASPTIPAVSALTFIHIPPHAPKRRAPGE